MSESSAVVKPEDCVKTADHHTCYSSRCYVLDTHVFDEKEHFKYYPFYEPYDATKTYMSAEQPRQPSKNLSGLMFHVVAGKQRCDTELTFAHDYGNGEKTYRYAIHNIFDKSTLKQTKKYMAVEEDVDSNSLSELKILHKYCDCKACRPSYIAKLFNKPTCLSDRTWAYLSTTWWYGATCSGCVYSTFADQQVIGRAREKHMLATKN